mmetsp:Transcript_28645/g.96465  ORF Transcript_28645/g.96465 Transcript_28645/m.96465 type:complete len:259 (+) Transcript_28645:686-1462(+)
MVLSASARCPVRAISLRRPRRADRTTPRSGPRSCSSLASFFSASLARRSSVRSMTTATRSRLACRFASFSPARLSFSTAYMVPWNLASRRASTSASMGSRVFCARRLSMRGYSPDRDMRSLTTAKSAALRAFSAMMFGLSSEFWPPLSFFMKRCAFSSGVSATSRSTGPPAKSRTSLSRSPSEAACREAVRDSSSARLRARVSARLQLICTASRSTPRCSAASCRARAAVQSSSAAGDSIVWSRPLFTSDLSSWSMSM